MATDRRRASRCGRACEICDTERAPYSVGWARNALTRITSEQYSALSNHERWLRGRAADISRRAWRKTPHFRRVQERMRASDRKCAVCRIGFAFSIDHIWPLVLGGTHEDTNLRFTCQSCNSRKGARV